MKKVKMGSVEILGYIGAIIWAAVVLLRGFPLSYHSTYLLLIGILPNLGAAWVLTMFAKWIVLFKLKCNITIKLHLFICTGISVLAFASEIVHDLFLGSPFDINDIIITVIAQIVIFLTPIIIKEYV